MVRFWRSVVLAIVLTVLSQGAAVAFAAVPVVAAESTYGVVAKAIGGEWVQVNSIIRNPNTDPHGFEATPAVARDVAHARLVVMNGLGYDAWMQKMLAADPVAGRRTVVAADAASGRVLPDRNPHIFYDAPAMLLVAERIAFELAQCDPAHAAVFTENLATFRQAIAAFNRRVEALRQTTPGLVAAATEPVYGYMFHALGWRNEGSAFQIAEMNDTEPSPAAVARFDDQLRAGNVKLLVYNDQVSSAVTRRLLAVAHGAGVPTVGVAEFVPPGLDYVKWQNQTLDAVEHALGRK